MDENIVAKHSTISILCFLQQYVKSKSSLSLFLIEECIKELYMHINFSGNMNDVFLIEQNLKVMIKQNTHTSELIKSVHRSENVDNLRRFEDFILSSSNQRSIVIPKIINLSLPIFLGRFNQYKTVQIRYDPEKNFTAFAEVLFILFTPVNANKISYTKEWNILYKITQDKWAYNYRISDTQVTKGTGSSRLFERLTNSGNKYYNCIFVYLYDKQPGNISEISYYKLPQFDLPPPTKPIKRIESSSGHKSGFVVPGQRTSQYQQLLKESHDLATALRISKPPLPSHTVKRTFSSMSHLSKRPIATREEILNKNWRGILNTFEDNFSKKIRIHEFEKYTQQTSRQVRVPHGSRNYGASCYVNALLQALRSSPILYQKYIGIREIYGKISTEYNKLSNAIETVRHIDNFLYGIFNTVIYNKESEFLLYPILYDKVIEMLNSEQNPEIIDKIKQAFLDFLGSQGDIWDLIYNVSYVPPGIGTFFNDFNNFIEEWYLNVIHICDACGQPTPSKELGIFIKPAALIKDKLIDPVTHRDRVYKIEEILNINLVIEHCSRCFDLELASNTEIEQYYENNPSASRLCNEKHIIHYNEPKLPDEFIVRINAETLQDLDFKLDINNALNGIDVSFGDQIGIYRLNSMVVRKHGLDPTRSHTGGHYVAYISTIHDSEVYWWHANDGTVQPKTEFDDMIYDYKTRSLLFMSFVLIEKKE